MCVCVFLFILVLGRLFIALFHLVFVGSVVFVLPFPCDRESATRIGSLSCVERSHAVLVVAAVAMSSPVHSSKNTWPSFPCLSLSVFGNAGGGRHRL